MSGQTIKFSAGDVDQPQTLTFGATDVSGAPQTAPAPAGGGILDSLINLLPAAGGTAGGILGGIGGTVAGMGVGGVPGAVGGAALGGGAGEALRQLVERLRGQAAPSSSLEAAKGIGAQGAIQGGAEALGAGIGKYVLQPVAKGVMRGYLKPLLAGVKVDKAREIVQTALDEALPVTKGGETRADRLIADINKQVGGMLQGIKGKVDLGAVADKVRAFAKAKYYKPGVTEGMHGDYEAAMEVADAIDKHSSLQLPNGARVTQVNASNANEIKTAVRPNSRAYGDRGASAEGAARKAAGAEMRQAIEDTAKNEGVSNIGPLNERERKLIDAQDAIKRAAGREENKGLNPTAIPNLIAGGVGAGEYARQRDPASAIATTLAIRLALSPAMMTRAAILASKLGQNGYAAATAARLAVQMVQSESDQQP